VIIINGSTKASPPICCLCQSLHLTSFDLSLDLRSKAPDAIWVRTELCRSWELSWLPRSYARLVSEMGWRLGNKRAVYMSPRLDTGTRTYNVHSGLPSPKPYITLILRTCGLELCGESDLCMHCNVDEMTSRIANSIPITQRRRAWTLDLLPLYEWSPGHGAEKS
jgi:hypothetical protein